MKIGYLGPGKCTFGFAAAEKFFLGKDEVKVEFVALPNHTEICRAVNEGEVDLGVVAIENVIDGIVTETVRAIDTFRRRGSLIVSGEVELPIELFLLRKAGDGSAPKRILAHPTAKGQSSKRIAEFQKANKNIQVETVSSNGAAAEAASKDDSCVAVSTARAEKEYGLVRVEPNSITDNPNNFTRFWIVGREKAKPTDNDKTCLLINLDQPVPGGVSKALAPFAERGINLLLIAPICIKGRKYEYTFLVEFLGSFKSPDMQAAYNAVCDSGICMDDPLVIGSYPSGVNK